MHNIYIYIYIYILKRLSLTFYLQNIITGNAAKIWNDLPIYGLTILATPYNLNQDVSFSPLITQIDYQLKF